MNADLISAVFLCCRGLFELAAHGYYVKKHILQHLKKNDLKAAWQFLYEVNLGSREMRDEQKVQDGESDYPEGPHIAKVIACFNEYFPDGQTRCHPEVAAATDAPVAQVAADDFTAET